MFSLFDTVRLDESSAKEEKLPQGLMIVSSIDKENRRYVLRSVNNGVEGVMLNGNEDKVIVVKPFVEVTCNKSEKGLEEAIDGMEKLAKAVRATTPRTVNILGTDYTVVEKPIKDCDGYCEKTTKEIAVAVKEDDCDIGNFEEHRKKVLRHEVIHAYHYESGLAENFENKQYGFSETLVDWFAYQSPKIFKTFEELGIL